MNSTVVFAQALVLALLVAVMRAFGHAGEAVVYAAAVVAAAACVWALSIKAWRGLPREARRDGLGRILSSAGLVVSLQFVLDAFGWVRSIEVGAGDKKTVLAMCLVAITVAAVIYMSSLIDWFYVRPHLLGSRGRVCFTSARIPWRLVTRIRLTHRLIAVLVFIAGLTALVALTANEWVRPLDETVAGSIAAAATITAGYYLTRAAPLVALATNPSILICDVVHLAEEFNVPDPAAIRPYFVVDIGWEGIKLREIQNEEPTEDAKIPPYVKTAIDSPPHDRMVDIGDIARFLRRRETLKPCSGSCRQLTGGCLEPSRDRTDVGVRPAASQATTPGRATAGA